MNPENESDGTDYGSLSYRPSAYYFRAALRSAKSREEAIEVGLHAVRELEMLKAWVRELGYEPPRQHVMQAEIVAKPASWRNDGLSGV